LDYFLEPLVDDPHYALALLQFIQHPDRLSVTGAADHYRYDVGVNARFYPWERTGFYASVSAENSTSSMPDTIPSNSHVGISATARVEHYLLPNLLLYASYSANSSMDAFNFDNFNLNYRGGIANYDNQGPQAGVQFLTVGRHLLLSLSSGYFFGQEVWDNGGNAYTTSSPYRAYRVGAGVTGYVTRRFALGVSLTALRVMEGASTYTQFTAQPTASVYLTDWMSLSLGASLPVYTHFIMGGQPTTTPSFSATLAVKF
jgi:hypothetical protein